MPDWSTLAVFTVSALILVVTPGPNTLYIATRSIQQGRAAGIASCAGVLAGTLMHITIAALGVSALLLSSVMAFRIVQYAGAAFLIFLGIQTMLAHNKGDVVSVPLMAQSLGQIFSQAVLVNLLNPKTTLFFTAFLPQFIDENQGTAGMQIFVLGALLAALGTVNDLIYVLVAGRCGHWLRGNVRFRRIQRFIAGTIYIGIGVAATLTGGPSTL